MTREEAIKIFNDLLLFGKAPCKKDELEDLCKIVLKALEQEPRKGHWIKRHDNVGWWYVCDKCGSTPLWDENTSEVVLSPYCPNCGADMRVDRSEE